MKKLTMNKASGAGHRYVSRERKGDRWEYTYAEDGKSASGAGSKMAPGALVHRAAEHRAAAAAHYDDAQRHSENGNHKAAAHHEKLAENHDKKAKKFAASAAAAKRQSSRSESNERIASPSEMEHATRSPGVSDKRMMTAAESGKLATIKRSPNSPWDTGKSMNATQAYNHEEKVMSKIAKALQALDFPASADSTLTGLAQRSADGIELLQQMLQDYEGANFGHATPVEVTVIANGDKKLADAEADGRREAEPVAMTSPQVDFRGNAPSVHPGAQPMSFGQPVMEKSVESQSQMGFLCGYDQVAISMGLMNHFASAKRGMQQPQAVAPDHIN